MNRLEAISYFTKEFKKLCPDEQEAATETKLAFAVTLGTDISSIYLTGQAPVKDSEEYRMREILRRRATGEPLAYILRERWFMGMRFRVTPAVLIPRNETELLAETATQLIRLEVKASVLDICTGSGCIAISLAKFTRANVCGSDISEDALKIARFNAKLNLLNVEFFQSDLFSEVNGRYDVITANPPYIAESEIPTLMPEVKDHEPLLALEAGSDGLKFYKRIAAEAPDYLNERGALLMEIGCEQGAAVQRLLVKAGFRDVRIIKDYSKLDRVVLARI